jgi:hypothetical protein
VGLFFFFVCIFWLVVEGIFFIFFHILFKSCQKENLLLFSMKYCKGNVTFTTSTQHVHSCSAAIKAHIVIENFQRHLILRNFIADRE